MSYRQRRRVSAGMHGRPPNLTSQLQPHSHDSSHFRQRNSFTQAHVLTPSPSAPHYAPSHANSNHSSQLLHQPQRANPQQQSVREAEHASMTNKVSAQDFSQLSPPQQFDHLFQLDWPDLTAPLGCSDPVRRDTVRTISPRDLAIRPARSKPHTPSSVPLRPVAPGTSHSTSSNRSSSTVNTPLLTPPTSNDSPSSPATSIYEVGDHHIPSPKTQARVKHPRPLLPAPHVDSFLNIIEPLPIELFTEPDFDAVLEGTDRAGLDDAFFSDPPTKQSKGLHNNNQTSQLAAPNSIEASWFAQAPWQYEHLQDHDYDNLLDSNILEHAQPQFLDSGYPPLSGNIGEDLDLNTNAGRPTQTDLLNDPLFPPLLDDYTASPLQYSNRQYLDLVDNHNVSSQDVPFASIETGVAAATRGEGSRRDTSRDNELISLREQGISYREIKQNYGFTEAESTLRGRFRTLEKIPQHRVRKPQWKDKDVSLLRLYSDAADLLQIRLMCTVVWEVAKQQQLNTDTRQVHHYLMLTNEQTLNKISWKKVTGEMKARGSYPYGFTTAKKKYFDVMRGKF